MRWQQISHARTHPHARACTRTHARTRIVCRLAIFPVDCIKSAMQTDSIIPSERKHPTMALAARNLWAEGGIRRFYKGFTPCLIRAVPANGAMLFTVDRVTALLNQA